MSRARDLANGTFSGAFAADSPTLVVDAANNRVGVGTASPSTTIDATLAAGGNYVATFQNTTSATPYNVWIKDAASATSGYPLLNVTDGAGTNTYLRVDSGTGNVGIGTGSPTSASGGTGLDVNGMLVVRKPLAAHQTSAGVLEFNNNIVSLRAYGSTSGSGVLAFSTGGGGGSTDTERARFDSNGHLILKKNLVLESTSEGIDFSGVGSSAKTLDDYEEGTFTPSFNSGTGITYTSQYGYYTKVGRVVTYNLIMAWSAGTSISYIITGLPYVVANTTEYYFMGGVYYSYFTFPSGDTQLTAYPARNTNVVYMSTLGSGYGGRNPTIGSSGSVYVTGFYYVDS